MCRDRRVRFLPPVGILVLVLGWLGTFDLDGVRVVGVSGGRGVLDQGRMFAALNRHRWNRRLSWAQVADQAEVPLRSLDRSRRGEPLNADNLVRLLVWMGQTDVARFVRV